MSTLSQPRLQGRHLQHPMSLCRSNQKCLYSQQLSQHYQKTLKTSSLSYPRFGIVTRSALISMDHGENWSVLIDSSPETGCGGPRPEKEHPSGAQLWSYTELVANTQQRQAELSKAILDHVPKDSSYVQGYNRTRNWASITTYSRPPCQLWVNQGCRDVTCSTQCLYVAPTKNASIVNNFHNITRRPWRHPASAIPGLELWQDRLWYQWIMEKIGLYL